MRKRPWPSPRPSHTLFQPKTEKCTTRWSETKKNMSRISEWVENMLKLHLLFVILGLADAIVEISGIHAGSLGIYGSTEITGLAGIVAGAAASIAMASAAYAQAKQGFQGNASVSAVFTGVSSLVSAATLASPYFLTRSNLTAIVISIDPRNAYHRICKLLQFNHFRLKFRKRFAELAGIMLGASVALFFFGTFVHNVAHLTISST